MTVTRSPDVTSTLSCAAAMAWRGSEWTTHALLVSTHKGVVPFHNEESPHRARARPLTTLEPSAHGAEVGGVMYNRRGT